MITIETETIGDYEAREVLLDRAMGPDRLLKPSQLLRDGRQPADDLALVARDGREVVGTVRLWDVAAGARPALLLGPLAVDPGRQGEGIGGRLMWVAIACARGAGHGAILLVGDASYYGRFGFTADLTRGLAMPGPVDPARFLGLELRPAALRGVVGPVVASNAASMTATAYRPTPRRIPLLAAA